MFKYGQEILTAVFAAAVALFWATQPVPAQEAPGFVLKAQEACSREDVTKGMILGGSLFAVGGGYAGLNLARGATYRYVSTTSSGQKIAAWSEDLLEETMKRNGFFYEKVIDGPVDDAAVLWARYGAKPRVGWDAVTKSELFVNLTAPAVVGGAVIWGTLGTVGGAYLGCASDAIEAKSSELYRDSWAEKTIDDISRGASDLTEWAGRKARNLLDDWLPAEEREA